MKAALLKCTLALVFVFIHVASRAQTWTGASSNDWFTAGNWSPAVVPGSASSVTIPGALATYPTLTGNVTIASLTMASGSQLHLNGNTFTDNGNVSLLSSMVDGGGSFTVNGAGNVNIQGNTLVTACSVLSYTSTFYFLNNTVTGNTVIQESASQASSTNYIDGNLFTGNLSVTHNAAADVMDEGYGASTPDHVTGNASFIIGGGGTIYIADAHGLVVDGDLTVNRTAPGNTELFNTPGSVGGNLSVSSFGGFLFIGNNGGAMTNITGTLNVSGSPGNFNLYRVKNGTAGGAITITPTSADIEQDTLKATVSVTGYTNLFYFLNNSITGNTTIGDNAAQNTGNNRIDGNLFTGNLNVTHNSASDIMDEGYGASSPDHVTGNAVFTITGAGPMYISDSHGLLVDGNLTINRTAAGTTAVFNTPGNVGGNFALTTVGGITGIGNGNGPMVAVGGTFNVSGTPSQLSLLDMKNAVAGGSVSISGNPNYVNIQNDTLKAPLSVTGYTNQFYCYNNSITGNTVFSDDASQNTGNNRIDGNLFTGNLTVTHNSLTDEMYEGYGVNQRDHVTGSAIFNLNGGGSMFISASHALQVDGNLTITRNASGTTSVFSTPGSVGGNFALSTVGGITGIGNGSGPEVAVGGTFNVSGTPSQLSLLDMKNAVAGGSVSISGNPNYVNIQNDTLKVSLSVTGYTNQFYLYNNSITGNTIISDDASQNTGNNRIDGNLFTGNLTVTHNSLSDEMDEGYGVSSPDHVTGNASFSINGGGSIYLSYSHPLGVDGNLTINRTASGITNVYNAPGNVGGNFSLSTIGGITTVGVNGGPVVNVGGTFNLAAGSSDLSVFRMKNSVAGGTFTSAASNFVNIQNDTLKDDVSITGYTNQFYIYNNSFTGNSTFADAAGQNTGNNRIDGNLFTGNLAVTHNSLTDEMDEGYGASLPDHVTGNAGFTINGAGPIYLSYSHGIQVDGNLTISRIAGGLTNVFNTSGTIGGNFSFASAGGSSTIGNNGGPVTNVGFGLTISGGSSDLAIYKMKNGTGGGSVTSAGSNFVSIQNDTLKADVTITGYTNQFYIYNNSLTGNSLFSDAASQNSGNNNIDGNLFTGNRTIVHNSGSDLMYEGYGASAGNVVRGRDSIVATAAPLYYGYSHAPEVDGDFVVNANAPANLLFNTGILFGGATSGHVRQVNVRPIVIPNVTMMKTGGGRLFLDTTLVITSSLMLTGGIIVDTPNKSLIIANGATAMGASDLSHVLGPVIKAGNTSFTFPVGDGTSLATIGISAPATATDTVRGAFYHVNPASKGFDTSAAHRAPSLQRVSGCEYWDLTHVAGSGNVFVTLLYGAPCGGITSPAALRVAHYNGTQWDDLGNGGTTGTASSGTITTANSIGTFSPFTLATINATLNPLPVQLISFAAQRKGTAAALGWSVARENEVKGYEVNRSFDGTGFSPVGFVNSRSLYAAAAQYDYADYPGAAGKVYYRLRVVNLDGSSAWSPVAVVDMGGAAAPIGFSPNPAKDAIQAMGEEILYVVVRNMQGGEVRRYAQPAPGELLNISSLQPGMYMVTIIAQSGTVSQTMVKR